MINYELLFVKSLGLTVVIETAVLWILTQYVFKKPEVKISMVIFTGIIASVATLPYLWFIFPSLFELKLSYQIVSETTAVLVETIIIFMILRYKPYKAFIISFSCNAVSFLTGLLINFP